MAWTNAFSIGGCELQCWRNGVQLTPEDMLLEGIVLSETAGVVTLDFPEVALTNSGELQARVVPSYDTNYASVRLSGMEAAVPDGTLYALWDGGGMGDVIDPFDAVSAAVTPDPYEFTPALPWTLAGMSLYWPVG